MVSLAVPVLQSRLKVQANSGVVEVVVVIVEVMEVLVVGVTVVIVCGDSADCGGMEMAVVIEAV